jgi:hypothetical protein
MKKDNKKVLVWTLAIAGIGLAGYVIYNLAKPSTNQKVLNPSSVNGLIDAVAGLFKKKEPTVSPYTGYNVDAGVNYYNTDISSVPSNAEDWVVATEG